MVIKIILGIIGIFAVLVVIGAIVGGGKKETAPTTTTQTTEQKQEAQKPKQWVTVIEISGNANKRTDTFALQGGKTRLTYDVKGNTAVIVSIYVLKEGQSLEKEGGFPEVTISESGTDSTFLTKKAGNYYLDVKAANATWNVRVEEER